MSEKMNAVKAEAKGRSETARLRRSAADAEFYLVAMTTFLSGFSGNQKILKTKESEVPLSKLRGTF